MICMCWVVGSGQQFLLQSTLQLVGNYAKGRSIKINDVMNCSNNYDARQLDLFSSLHRVIELEYYQISVER